MSGNRRPIRALMITLFLAAQGTTGCALLLVGGAAGGGYYVGKDDRSFGTIVDDASITGSVKAKLIRDPRIDALDINVETRDGIVTLHGHVPSRGAANRAAALARAVKGVARVESQLAVIPGA